MNISMTVLQALSKVLGHFTSFLKYGYRIKRPLLNPPPPPFSPLPPPFSPHGQLPLRQQFGGRIGARGRVILIT